MKFALILMVKNEELILNRCLEAVKDIVDYYCIHDTGSTDTTREIAKTFLDSHDGCLTHEPFQNFGYSRTRSFINAQTFLKDKGLDLTKTYGLLLDADMVFVPGKLCEHPLGEIGYRIIQKNGAMEYYNCRVIRMDYDWKCIGVTHEYWSGPTGILQKDICFINDKNDGGCKHDKFERDVRLLTQGLIDEPANERYMFYLAQTYKCLGRYDESIVMYKKRIEAGGWIEEVWYSYYMIGECYLNLKNFFEFEKWMQMAYVFRPTRVESIHSLAKFFREVGQHYKAYHYIKIGESVSFPKNDVLFIETNVYNGLFDYEASIVEYYIHKDRCLNRTINYMLKMPDFQETCLSNLKFSVKAIPSISKPLSICLPYGNEYNPSAISVCNYPMVNVRYINYWIHNGDYFTNNGAPVQTLNAYYNLETNEVVSKMDDLSISLERHETSVKGLEDIRVFFNGDKLKFTATSVREYVKDKIMVVSGDYNVAGIYENVSVLNTPSDRTCEKNWLPITDTDTFIYGWYPYTIVDSESKIVRTMETPPLFSLFRGSAPPIRYDDGWLSLVHFVEYSKPRKYYHCFVLHDNTLSPTKISLPFFFRELGIEFCVSMRFANSNIECYTSLFDKDPHCMIINPNIIEWVDI